MTGIAYLIEAFAEGDLVRPRPQARNLVDLSRAVAGISGVQGLDMSDNAREIAAAVGEPDHLALVLVDGMGMNVIESLPPTPSSDAMSGTRCRPYSPPPPPSPSPH